MLSMQELEGALAVIRRAIHDEITGQRFYRDASFYCIDPWAKEVFATLAQEEEEHTHLLLAEYESLSTGGQWLDPDTARASAAQADITRITFLDDEAADQLFPSQLSISDAIERTADDLSSLALGIEMEQRAIALYSDEAERLTDPAAKEAYWFLVEEETRHFEWLTDRWEKLAGIPFAAP
jgi:rubrerythrin